VNQTVRQNETKASLGDKDPEGPDGPENPPQAGRSKPLIRSQADFAAGLFLLACGLFGWWFGQPLKVGTAFRMGPGYTPQMLSGILCLFGVALLVIGLVRKGPPLAAWRLKPILLVVGALVVFAMTIERTGLLISSVLAVGMAGLASPQQRFRDTALLALGMAIAACLLFPFALQLPLRILP
jgi:hypothetical protein